MDKYVYNLVSKMSKSELTPQKYTHECMGSDLENHIQLSTKVALEFLHDTELGTYVLTRSFMLCYKSVVACWISNFVFILN